MKLIFVFSLIYTYHVSILQYFRAYPYTIHKIFYNAHPSSLHAHHSHNHHFERSEDSQNDVGNHHSILRFAKVMQKSCNDVQSMSKSMLCCLLGYFQYLPEGIRHLGWPPPFVRYCEKSRMLHVDHPSPLSTQSINPLQFLPSRCL